MLKQLKGEAIGGVVNQKPKETIEQHRAKIEKQIKETRHQQIEAIKVQTMVEDMQKQIRRLVYTMNG